MNNARLLDEHFEVAIVEPAKGKRGTSAGWLVSAADVGDDGSEREAQATCSIGKVPTVAAMGSRAPKGAAAKHTEQSAHQAAICGWPWSTRASACQKVAK